VLLEGCHYCLQEIGDLMDDLGAESDGAMKHYVQALNIRQERFS
jgi:hypothetical protein